MNNDIPDHRVSYRIEEITLFSDRSPIAADIGPAKVDLDIFENIERPYLTAVLQFVDDKRVYEGYDILGGERVGVLLSSGNEDSKFIRKIFYINKVVSTQKANDHSGVVTFHLVEDVKYISNLQNLNRSYNGKCGEIIQKICGEFLSKEILKLDNDKQSIKVIVPNMEPLDACTWLTRRATTNKGYPFYFFSTIKDDELRFVDLGTLLKQDTINKQNPFRGWQSASQSTISDAQRRVIKEYKHQHIEDLYSLIHDGLIGANYEFIDLTKNDKKTCDWDVIEDMIKPLMSDDVISKSRQPNALYSPEFKLNGNAFHQIQSTRISRIGGISAFNDDLSYSETNDIAEYKLEVISNAMHAFLQKAPINITVNGYDFISTDAHTTIGNNVKVEFLSSDAESQKDPIDKKLSGDYMICAIKHMFKKEKYEVELTGVKLSNYKMASS